MRSKLPGSYGRGGGNDEPERLAREPLPRADREINIVRALAKHEVIFDPWLKLDQCLSTGKLTVCPGEPVFTRRFCAENFFGAR